MQATMLSVRESRAVQRALRILENHMQQPEATLRSPGAVRDYLRTMIGRSEREEFVALWLDNQNRLIKSETLFFGTLTACSVYPREVVRSALLNNAAAVIFAHNHPSGSNEPSNADIRLTHTLKQALCLVDVSVLDHFVVTESIATSMVEKGVMQHG